MNKVVIAGLLLISATGVADAQDLAAGEQSFKKCLPCHAVGEDARNKVGPLLNGLEGRRSGTIDASAPVETKSWSQFSLSAPVRTRKTAVPSGAAGTSTDSP